ncbi:hypothetical protein F53441_6324 [Fusarium austroafricanum]|uniref:Uncharacterized protein n=1 Tax=Fusarium austroafricanum TaxID=2364996 RepID=A0A8H4NYU6_9HYPO|nr:hypothetical protein F53441_6324 [Fusarium austroafricanum]
MNHFVEQQSIRSSLTVSNPKCIDEIRQGSPPTTPMVEDLTVSKWTDFSLQTLSGSVGNILQEQVTPPRGIPSGPLTLNNLGDIEDMLKSRIWPLLWEPNLKGAEVLRRQLGNSYPEVSIRTTNSISGVRCPCQSFTLPGDRDQARLFVGICLSATAWKSKYLSERRLNADQPIRRIATYCLHADRRYGFILTSEELVVVCVSSATRNLEDPCQLEWEAIPWAAQGGQDLTVPLSLWFMTMMSLNRDYRRICSSRQLLPMNHWVRQYNTQGQPVFRHHISGREVVDYPFGASTRDITGAN